MDLYKGTDISPWNTVHGTIHRYRYRPTEYRYRSKEYGAWTYTQVQIYVPGIRCMDLYKGTDISPWNTVCGPIHRYRYRSLEYGAWTYTQVQI